METSTAGAVQIFGDCTEINWIKQIQEEIWQNKSSFPRFVFSWWCGNTMVNLVYDAALALALISLNWRGVNFQFKRRRKSFSSLFSFSVRWRFLETEPSLIPGIADLIIEDSHLNTWYIVRQITSSDFKIHKPKHRLLLPFFFSFSSGIFCFLSRKYSECFFRTWAFICFSVAKSSAN